MFADPAFLFNFIQSTYNPTGQDQISIQPYAFPIAFTAIAPGTSPNGTITIQANADFVCTSLRYRCVETDGNTLADVVPEIRVLLTDGGSQEKLMQSPVDISTYFGQIGKAPYDLPWPRIIAGRSDLLINLQNYSPTLTYANLELTFAGVLVRGFKPR